MKKNLVKVMIYCQDGLGLGHLRRNINIAHELSRLAPNSAFLLVADSPLAPFFNLPANSDFIKLPTIIKVKAGVWKTNQLPLLPFDRIRTIRSQMLSETMLAFRPDIVLVDHMPHGAQGELIPALRSLRQESPQSRICLGLRDILGSPEVIIRQWRTEGAYKAIANYYDFVLVYGNENIFDLVTEYQFPKILKWKTHYCGYVCISEKAVSPKSVNLSEKFPTPKPFTVLVMGGGGSDAHFFMDSVLDMIQYLTRAKGTSQVPLRNQARTAVPFNTVILTGPFMPRQERQALVEKASGLPIIVERMQDDSLHYLKQVDLVVSMAGYNTTCELLKYAKKAVMIPRAGPSAEQSMRCRILQKRGLISSIHPNDLNPQALAGTILTGLYDQDSADSSRHPNLKGATKTAQFLLEHLA